MPRDAAYDRHAYCKIYINGFDATDVLEPFLISVTVTSVQDGEGDHCEIELDDRDGRVPIAGQSAPVEVWMGWDDKGPDITSFQTGSLSALGATTEDAPAQLPWSGGLRRTFKGGVRDFESGFSRRGGGRRIWITAFAGDLLSEEKQAKSKTWGEGEKDYNLDQSSDTAGGSGTEAGGSSFSGGPSGSGGGDSDGIPFSQVLKDIFKDNAPQISGSIGDIKRKFWHQGNESARQFASRMARELGGSFAFKDGSPTVTSGAGEAADGESMTTIEAVWGENLISWRIKPFTTRPDYKGGKQNFYKAIEGAWDSVKGDFNQGGPFLGGAKALMTAPNPAPNKQVGGQWNSGFGEGVENDRGQGWCVINGDPQAQAGAVCHIQGARQGVDGNYRISEAEHKYTRAGGYTTRCKLDRPSPDEQNFVELMWPSPDTIGVPPAQTLQDFKTPEQRAIDSLNKGGTGAI